MVAAMSDTFLSNPLDTLAHLASEYTNGLSLREQPSTTSDHGISAYIAASFDDLTKQAKIPSYNNVPFSELESGAVCRFAAFIQDPDASGTEVFVGYSKDSSSDKWKSHRFGPYDGPEVGYGASDNIILEERTSMYATSIPGEASWMKENELPELDDVSLGGKARYLPDRYPKNAPHRAALLKFYAGCGANIKVCDIVEVIGLLEFNDSNEATTEDEDDHDRIAMIHVLSFRQFPNIQGLYLHQNPTRLTDHESARAKILTKVSSVFSGDMKAAELLLLSLLSSVIRRQNQQALGMLSLNVYGCPGDVAPKLVRLLKSVLPSLMSEKLDLDTLNMRNMVPSSDGETLRSGTCQLAQGTCLLLDEGGMKEGQLGDRGVRQIRALTRMITAQAVPFQFPFSEFEVETDCPVIILGQTKTILPVNYAVALKPQLQEATASASPLSNGELEDVRKYLASARNLEVNISSEISERIQNDFVNMKKAGRDDPVQALGGRIEVARLLAKSHLRTSMLWDDWEHAGFLVG
ncbi:hypothetical protein YB2330_000441 [Saitoella coloradoensis]